MGEVYQAHDDRLGRDVAIKVSAAHFSEQCQREARAIGALNHPNICTLYDVGPDYLVMELVPGPTLAEVIAAAQQRRAPAAAASSTRSDPGLIHLPICGALGTTPGTRLGAPEIVASVGAGGMGELYRARNLRFSRVVAPGPGPARDAARISHAL
jgi:hypothetical protein